MTILPEEGTFFWAKEGIKKAYHLGSRVAIQKGVPYSLLSLKSKIVLKFRFPRLRFSRCHFHLALCYMGEAIQNVFPFLTSETPIVQNV